MEPKMSASPNRPKIGFVSLGQGPRPDLNDYHHRLLAKAGIDASIVWRHALDGLAESELAAMAAKDSAPAIRTNLRQADCESLLGAGWMARWLDRDSFIPFVQSAVFELEAVEGVDLTIICAAEEFPDGSFRSNRPVIFPSIAMSAHAQLLANTKPQTTIGLLVYGERQRLQQQSGWAAKPWAHSLTLAFCGHGGDLDAAAGELLPHKPDLVLVWAYGAAVGRDRAGPEFLSKKLGVPVISAAAASMAMAVNLLAFSGDRSAQ
jgi:hypothetical protein